MSLPFIFQNGGDFEFKPGLPPDYRGPFVAKATQGFSTTNKASIVSQHFIDKVYSLRYTVARFLENLQLSARVDVPGLYVRFQLKSSQRMKLDGISRINIREGHFSGTFIDSINCECRFQTRKEYHCLDIYFSPELLQEFTSLFPELANVLQKAEATLIPSRPSWILEEMRQIIDSILKTSMPADLIPFYYDLKVREMLTHILHYKFNRKPAKFILNSFELYRVHEAKAILSEHISKKSPDLRKLAHKVGLPEGKLKDGFRQEFHLNLYDWLLQERMKLALHLILTTRIPIKMIAQEVGYLRSSAFIDAFRERYKNTPGSFRR